ncbi:MAG: FAD-binding oxidoreductase [Actinomycetota bacterium]|nr:FAD-binding oxidoreductase [Actinomycetota bacterium]MDA2972221.1 FAD-binding oxidoreductase [Actinomycetota bacterium]MDA3001309.1 FAD-binding oxidoreductase [Actinomycetota bacterium]
MDPDYRRQILTGWGLTSPSAALVGDVSPAELVERLKEPTGRGVIARGLGRSYGDAAQNAGGVVLRIKGSPSEIVIDSDSGTVTVGAGVSLDELMKFLVPRGWFVPVTPGTRFVTVGGAIASDIHGKNHHVEGSFGSHVRRMRVVVASGDLIECSPSENSDLFWTTIGGMGLTGFVVEATFALIAIETSRCLVDTVRCRDFDELIGEMSVGDDDVRYSVAWVDLVATGRHFGRGVLWRGDHAKLSDLDAEDASDPLSYAPRRLGSIPPVVPGVGLVGRATTRVFNEIWLRKEPMRRAGSVKSIPSYFHPLDSISSWNRLYGRSGFVQYQFVVPFGVEDRLRAIVERIVASGLASPLVVLKRFGSANEAPLSFPMPGWTLTVDMPAGAEGLSNLARSLDDAVLEAGGRHYLAKDALTSASVVRAGYPRLDEWRSIRDRWDPDRLFVSDLARRLQLI